MCGFPFPIATDKSRASCGVVTDKVSRAGQVKGEESDLRKHTGLPVGGLGGGLAVKKPFVKQLLL